MKTLKIVLITIVTVSILLGTTLFLIGLFKPKPAGIYVDTSPSSSVYVNGAFLGKTPLEKTVGPGLIDIKMVPEVTDQNLLAYETKITVTPGIQTVVRREFGKSEDESSGDVISFDKEPGGDASLIVISTPDNAQVSIDGVPRGFAPTKTTLAPAGHQVTVRADGYTDRVMTVATKAGYRLTLFAKLAKTSEATLAPSPSPTPSSQYFVLILSTPTGYLRVRTQPATLGEEIAQVKPGEKYKYLGTDISTGWLKIQYEEAKPGLPDGISGWVTNQYAKEVDSLGNDVSSISPSPSPKSP